MLWPRAVVVPTNRGEKSGHCHFCWCLHNHSEGTPCAPTVSTDEFYLDFNACCMVTPKKMPLVCDNFNIDEYLIYICIFINILCFVTFVWGLITDIMAMCNIMHRLAFRFTHLIETKESVHIKALFNPFFLHQNYRNPVEFCHKIVIPVTEGWNFRVYSFFV